MSEWFRYFDTGIIINGGNSLKIIDVSGLGNSGRTAFNDLFREIKSCYVHPNLSEFNLIRLPDGILDLHHALCGSWSPSRSDFAIKRFRKLCQSLSVQYSETLTDKFIQYTDAYIESLINDSIFIEGWYDSLYENRTQKEKLKSVLKRVGLFTLSKKIYKLVESDRLIINKTKVFLSNGSSFIEKTKIYLENILCLDIMNSMSTIVTGNAFEPFNPVENIKYFNDAISIIIDRDPRDIYASVIKTNDLFKADFEKNDTNISHKYLLDQRKDFLGANDINIFIRRQKLYREKMQIQNNNPRVIYLNYEDLVLKYDDTIQAIFSKVGIDPDRHTKKKHFFDPAQSAKNVGIWRKMKDSEEIKLIETELNEYLYPI